MRKLDFCLCENKGADQLCSNCTADQHLCFRYMDDAVPPLPISKISSFYPSVTVQAGLCRTWSETLMTVFSHTTVHLLYLFIQLLFLKLQHLHTSGPTGAVEIQILHLNLGVYRHQHIS